MGNKKGIFQSLILIIFVCTVLFGCISDEKYYVTWKDADGSLIEYSTINSDYDPSSRELPFDDDEWQYTGWNVIKTENRIECTALRIKKIKIQWVDADGSILKQENLISSDFTENLFSLPNDTDEWHYTEWVKSTSTDGYIYKAKRIPKIKYIWKDASGEVLKEEYIVEGESPAELDLPQGNEKWNYTDWDYSFLNGEHIYTAVRTPNASYFVGNVFQIVIKDSKGTPLGTGSGFVINDAGWFITNNHVMDEASSAVAFFDIKDQENGSRYTQLNILGGIFNSSEKDIFIGKIEGYEKIKSYYNNITFTENYTTGEISYTVGYPNASVKMEINAGVILEEYSNIYDKLNGVYYILSDSYIAPGSSGGILINESFEVIGITTIGLYADDNMQVYTAGGSVPTFVFSSWLGNYDETKIKKLTDIYK